MKLRFTFFILVMLLAAAAPATAQHAHESDVILAIENNQILTNVFHDRLYEHARLWITNIDDGFTDEPGYDAVSGTFQSGSTVGIAIRKALRKWDDRNKHFHNIADESMEIYRFSFFIETPVSDPATPAEYPSLTLGSASSSGALHVHPWYFLTSPASDGMYLLELEMWTNMPGIARSEPFWIIFLKNEVDQAVIHEAEEWVEDHFINPIPISCPGDVNGDEVVNGFDLVELLGNWGPVPAGHPADLDGNQVVNGFDLVELLGNWGPCP